MTEHEAQDVQSAIQGDNDAFCRLVGSCSNAVTAITFSVLGDRQESEDVAQEVFLNAWRRLDSLNNPASFGPWVRQMARHAALSQLRRRRPRSHVQHVLETRESPAPSPAQVLDEATELRWVADALAELNDGTREVVILYYREGQQISQVAALLELSEAAVKKRLSRAREQLKASVLARMEAPLRASAPGALFVAAVAAGMVSPGVAGAATGVALKGAGKAALLTGLGGAAAGTLLGSLGMRYGVKKEADSIQATPEVREALTRVGRQGVLLIVCVGCAFVAIGLLRLHPYFVALPTAVLSVGLAWLSMIRAPAITRAHVLSSGRPDAQAFLNKLARRRWLGFVVGQLASWGAVLWVMSMA